MTGAWQTMSGHTTIISTTYNALGDPLNTVQTVDGLNWATSYAYDYGAGSSTATYPSGAVVVQQTDGLRRLSEVTRDASPVAAYAYDDANGTVTIAYANGVTTTLEVDGPGRVTRVQTGGPGGELADYVYGYDRGTNRTSMQRAHESGSPADVFEYDGLDQLTRVWYGADAIEPATITTRDSVADYNLDLVYNRLRVSVDGAGENYLPNNGLRLTNSMNRYEQVGARALSYDPKGNLLSDVTNTYTYDDENRQITMTGPGGTAEYVYDALNRRVAKVVDGVTTYFVYNAAYQVIEERDGGGALAARYTYGAGIDELLTMERGGTAYSYHRDALGSVTEVTDAGGALVERYTYDVYGEPSVFDGTGTPLAGSAMGNPYLFTGRRYDPESANYYYRARMYSPELGRYLQMDPIGYVDGMNAYAYTNSNPVNRVDPSGRDFDDCSDWCMGNFEDDRDEAWNDYLQALDQCLARCTAASVIVPPVFLPCIELCRLQPLTDLLLTMTDLYREGAECTLACHNEYPSCEPAAPPASEVDPIDEETMLRKIADEAERAAFEASLGTYFELEEAMREERERQMRSIQD
jgi:RHS repeat-associated protein